MITTLTVIAYLSLAAIAGAYLEDMRNEKQKDCYEINSIFLN